MVIGFHIPTAEIFARHRASGLTRYSYDAVVSVAAECVSVEAEYQAALDVASPVLAPHMQWIGCIPAELEMLHALTCAETGYAYCGSIGHGSSEMFPLRKWEQAIRKTRTVTAEIRRELARLQESAA